MTREEAKQLLPVIQAFANGKEIERHANGEKEWKKTDYIVHTDCYEYRIKPEPKFRPFKDKEECWKEMQKHTPVGYVNENDDITIITNLNEGGFETTESMFKFSEVFEILTFADGAPFGIKED